MKKIPLTQNKYAIVDDDDYDDLSQYRWTAIKSIKKDGTESYHGGRLEYSSLSRKSKVVLMDKQIIGNDSKVEHINGNKLDNRKENLKKVLDMNKVK